MGVKQTWGGFISSKTNVAAVLTIAGSAVLLWSGQLDLAAFVQNSTTAVLAMGIRDRLA